MTGTTHQSHSTERTPARGGLEVLVDGRSLPVTRHFSPRPDFPYVRRAVLRAVHAWERGERWEVRASSPVEQWRFHPASAVEVLAARADGCAFRLLRPGPVALLAGEHPPLLVQALPRWLFDVPPGAVTAESLGIRPHADARETCDALNHALARLSARGGGVLALGPGEFPVTTVRMPSRVRLHLGEHTVLRGPEDPALYLLRPLQDLHRDLPESLIPGARRSLVEFNHVHDSGLSGPGVIDGGGSELRRRHLTGRPLVNHVFAVGCDRLQFEGVTLLDSEFWSTHLVLCREVRLRHMLVLNEVPPPGWAAHLGGHAARWTWNNADGINPDSSERVTIEDCLLHTGDDCVPIKNTGCFRNQLRDVRGIVCRRCVMITPVTAMKLGTETRGERMEDIVFEDIDVVHAGRPIGVELKDGVVARNITFRNIRVAECNRPFDFVILRREDQRDQTRFSSLEGVHVDGLEVGRYGIDGAWFECRIQGLDPAHGIRGIRFDRVSLGGRRLADPGDGLIRTNAYAQDIRFA